MSLQYITSSEVKTMKWFSTAEEQSAEETGQEVHSQGLRKETLVKNLGKFIS